MEGLNNKIEIIEKYIITNKLVLKKIKIKIKYQ